MKIKKHSLGAAAVEFLVLFIMLFEVNQLMLNFFKKLKYGPLSNKRHKISPLEWCSEVDKYYHDYGHV